MKIRALMTIAATLLAQGSYADDADLRAAVQNPISSLISVPLKFSFDNGAPNGKANSLTIQPVIPVTVGDWNLISRFIIPLYDAPGGVTGLPGIPGGGNPAQSGREIGRASCRERV